MAFDVNFVSDPNIQTVTNLGLVQSEHITKSIHQLARDGDLDNLKILLAAPNSDALRSINELDEKKLTPLHYAAKHSNIEVMKLLVEHGANVNKLGDDAMSPLHYAARLVFENNVLSFESFNCNTIPRQYP